MRENETLKTGLYWAVEEGMTWGFTLEDVEFLLACFEDGPSGCASSNGGRWWKKTSLKYYT
jgi:hypothetical protein